MKLIGMEGMSPENIRDEVNRGGRLVIYTYCISILVMTFKRPAGIRLIRAGHNPAMGGLGYVGISLLFGWWGFPWGPIYTVETIYRNLCGGIDVTDDVLNEILPPAASAKAAPAAPAQSTFAPPPAPAGGFNLKVAGLMIGAVAVAVALGLSIYCYQKQQDLTVVLASGLDQPYTVVLNGQSYTLKPHGSEVLQLPEGDFTLQDAAGGHVVGDPRTFSFTIPLFSHLDGDKVAIINPDRAAILLNSEVPYYNETATPPADETARFTILANQPTYFIAKPDFVIVKALAHISMPAHTVRMVKTRLENFAGTNLNATLEALTEKSGYPAAREHLMILARHRSDEALLTAAMQNLKPEDVRPFFQLRLAERPVLVEWHRYYTRAMEYTHPELDLEKEYRTALQADPGNSALMYLLGRQTADYAEARRLWEQALTATPPCFYAHGAMGFDAMCEARFADALAHYTASEKAGIGGPTRKEYRRQIFWALGQPATIIAELAPERKADPLNLNLADEEIRATLAVNRDAAAAQKIKDAYLTAYKATKPDAKDLAETDAYLQAGIAYQKGDLPAYAKLLSRFESPYYKFRVALAQGDLKSATAASLAGTQPRAQEMLLLYLLARRSGDDAAADAHFQTAIDAMQKESHGYRQAAKLLSVPEPDAEAISGLHIDVEDKRVLLTALGLRQPAKQIVYFGLARKLNFNPEFPYQFLRPILAELPKK